MRENFSQFSYQEDVGGWVHMIYRTCGGGWKEGRGWGRGRLLARDGQQHSNPYMLLFLIISAGGGLVICYQMEACFVMVMHSPVVLCTKSKWRPLHLAPKWHSDGIPVWDRLCHHHHHALPACISLCSGSGVVFWLLNGTSAAPLVAAAYCLFSSSCTHHVCYLVCPGSGLVF